MNKNKLSLVNEELPELRLSELKESFTQDEIRINELKKFPNFLSPLLQKIREIQNKRKTKAPGIDNEYKRIEQELAEQLMFSGGKNRIIEARINEKEWVILEMVPHYDLTDKDKIVSFLEENNLSYLIINNKVKGAKINKKGQREDIKDIEFDEKRLYSLLNERIKSGFSIPEFFDCHLQRKIKVKKVDNKEKRVKL